MSASTREAGTDDERHQLVTTSRLPHSKLPYISCCSRLASFCSNFVREPGDDAPPNTSYCDATRLHLFIDDHASTLMHPPTMANGVPGFSRAEWLKILRASERFASLQPGSARADEQKVMRHKIKGEVRRAFPCGEVLVEPVNQGNCLGKLLGQRIIVRPGTSASHCGFTTTIHKPATDTRLDVQLSAPKQFNGANADAPPAGLIWMSNAALGVGLAPQIVQPGPVLEEASLLAGDEILWIDHDEAKSASSAAALLAAAHGDVTIIARRKREEPLADWWTDFVTVGARA